MVLIVSHVDWSLCSQAQEQQGAVQRADASHFTGALFGPTPAAERVLAGICGS